MRLAFAALTLLGYATTAQAAGDYDKLVDTFVAVCVHPVSPKDWLAAADGQTKLANWLPDPDRSRPRFGLTRSIEEQREMPAVWQEQAWFLPDKLGRDATDLDIWAAIHAGAPYSTCTLSLPGAASREMISALRVKLA